MCWTCMKVHMIFVFNPNVCHGQIAEVKVKVHTRKYFVQTGSLNLDDTIVIHNQKVSRDLELRSYYEDL